MAKKKTERYPYFKKYFRLTDMGKNKGVLYFLLQLFLYTGYVAF